MVIAFTYTSLLISLSIYSDFSKQIQDLKIKFISQKLYIMYIKIYIYFSCETTT